ncbi:MAG TPA: DUF4872 domain-containing protein [Acidobacteriota bacterium]|jgi:hypothetical protein|nr:DUF4872 domain-containing protein [Acidobacteriota bacterium]
MTKQRELKHLVRDRMAKTGERYTAARAQILAKLSEPPPPAELFPGLLNGYDRFGGIQGDTAVLHNVLRHAGTASAITGKPYTEAMINGLCGGPGFLYAVFEYKGWQPMLTLALRSRSMPDAYVAAGLSRLGLRLKQRETTSPKSARKALDEALSAGKAAICVADIASLPWYGLPKEFAGAGPHLIAVVGRDGDDVWIDDRSPRPIRLQIDQLDKARARYRQGKNRLITLEGPQPKYDAKQAIRDAVAGTARSYVEPAVPKSFWVNCGFSGIDKWRQMLTDRKDKKGWPTVFADAARAYAGLHRAYDCIEHQFTAPAGGRAFYADFLEEAARALDQPILKQAATAYREAGALWARIASLIAECGDAAVRQACEIADRRLELGDAHGEGLTKEASELWQKRHNLAGECKLTKDAALSLYAKVADVVGQISDAERAAVELLNRSLGSG